MTNPNTPPQGSAQERLAAHLELNRLRRDHEDHATRVAQEAHRRALRALAARTRALWFSAGAAVALAVVLVFITLASGPWAHVGATAGGVAVGSTAYQACHWAREWARLRRAVGSR